MKCPRDGTSLITEPVAGNAVIDRCPSCSGVWLDQRELELLQQQSDVPAARLDDIDLIGGAYELARQRARPEIACPRCSEPLAALEYAYCSQILIDRCIKCGGVWLDQGELEALERFFKRETRPRERFWETLREASRIWRGGFLDDLVS